MNNIQDKVVVVTGASSGIGKAIVRKLASEGASVVLAARRKDRLENIAGEINTSGGKASYYVVDVTVEKQIRDMVDDVVARLGRLDVMVGNAGLMAQAPLSSLKVDEWDRMIDINIKGVLYGVAAAWPVFEKQQSGHFINISSVAGIKVAAPTGTVYSATKYAVRAISEGIRVESAGKFRSTVVYPGYVESELMYGSSDEKTRQAVMSGYEKYAIPAGSVANAVAYAISQPDDTAINEIVIRPTSQEF